MMKSLDKNKKKSRKAGKSKAAAGVKSHKEHLDEAFTFDDKMTRRMNIQDIAMSLELILSCMKNMGLTPSGNSTRLGISMISHPLGVMLTNVKPGLGAAAVGLIRGDVIVRVNGEATTSHIAAAEALRSKPNTESGDIEISYYRAADAEVQLSAQSSSCT